MSEDERIVNLAEHASKPKGAVIDILRKALARAESGEMIGVAVIAQYRGDATGIAYRYDHHLSILGGIEWLKHTILHENDE